MASRRQDVEIMDPELDHAVEMQTLAASDVYTSLQMICHFDAVLDNSWYVFDVEGGTRFSELYHGP